MSTYLTFCNPALKLNERGAVYDARLQQGGKFEELNKAWFFTMAKQLANFTYVCVGMHCAVSVISFATYLISLCDRKLTINSMWIRNQLYVTSCYPLFLLYKLLNIPTRGDNTTQSSAPEDGHMVARNMLSNL